MSLDLVGGDLPLPLGGGLAVGVAPSDVDVVIDNIPFWLCISKDSPYQRETAQFQRDQVDLQPEAGEQSLAGWWARSQMSFHYGAGLDYLDTAARPDPSDRVRFKDSRNVDVWTPGVVTVLPASTATLGGTGGEPWWMDTTIVGTTEYTIAARSSVINVHNGSSWAAYGVTQLRAFCTDGVNMYFATPIGVYRASITVPGTATLLYNTGSDVPMVLAWVKQRLMFGYGASLYSLDVAGTALPAPKYTHPVAGWTWSSLSDGPDGIIAAGYAGLSSGIFKMELSKIDDAPVLGPGIALLSMPGGERILSSYYYLGSLLVLGTNRGVRVCPFDSYYGTISLGPLSVETDSPVTAFAGYDRFIYAGSTLDGEPALLRVDLGAPLDQQNHYAWAPDLTGPAGGTGAVTAITVRQNGAKWWASKGGPVLIEGTTPTTRTAWLQTARIRMATVEDKNWSYGYVRGVMDDDSPIRVDAQTPNYDWALQFNATAQTRFGMSATRSEWIALRFTLAPGASMSSYGLQALPAGKRQRLISMPVWCTDNQVTRSGIHAGYPGWAVSRLALLEAIEESGAEITVTAPALFPQSVVGVIEKLTFVQIADRGDQGSGTGGQLQIILRTTR